MMISPPFVFLLLPSGVSMMLVCINSLVKMKKKDCAQCKMQCLQMRNELAKFNSM
jgi:hypothetical protein